MMIRDWIDKLLAKFRRPPTASMRRTPASSSHRSRPTSGVRSKHPQVVSSPQREKIERPLSAQVRRRETALPSGFGATETGPRHSILEDLMPSPDEFPDAPTEVVRHETNSEASLHPEESTSSSLIVVDAQGDSLRRRRARPSATPEQERKFLEFMGPVYTAKGGDFHSTDKQRRVVAFLGDGTLLVDKDRPISAELSEIRETIKHKRLPVAVELAVDIRVLRLIHEKAEQRQAPKGKDNLSGRGEVVQEMQQEFLNIVFDAADKKCTDIHVNVGRHEAEISVRRDGAKIHRSLAQVPWAKELCSAAFSMTDMSDTNYRPLEYQPARISDITHKLPEGVQALRLQYSPLPNDGRYLAVRLLYVDSKGDATGDVDALGYAGIHLEQFRRLRRKRVGFNVIAGPTGSGKSTTLQRTMMVQMRERRGQDNFITIENPPEFVIPGAAQFPVLNAKDENELSVKFTQAISSALRSDPDVIMIGEIRDNPSAQLAFAASMTGHQVWASVHANNASSIIERLRDLNVEQYKLNDPTLVTGLIGQRLVRKLCSHCKIAYVSAKKTGRLDASLCRDIERVAGDMIDGVYLSNHDGCEKCDHKGTNGREVVAEIIIPDSEFMKHMRNGDKEAAVNYWLDNLDGMTMLEHATQKMVRGLCDPEDVFTAGELSDFRDDRREIVFGKFFDTPPTGLIEGN
jgi:general secretion pathway protein E